MKVTRPPGRDPAGRQTTKPASIDQIAKVRNGLRVDNRCVRAFHSAMRRPTTSLTP